MSSKFRDVDVLAEDFKSSFGSPANSESSYDLGGIKTIWNKIVISRLRLGILFGACFLISMFVLAKMKADFIMSKSPLQPSTIDKWLLIKYAFIWGIALFAVIFLLSYKFPIIKEIMFKTDDCDLCKG